MSLNFDEALKAYFLSRFHYPNKLIPTVAYPRNWAPEGPTSISLLARPSPSTMGGMLASRCLLTSLHVTRVGALHFRGGMRSRRPLWRHPRMAPPRASTMKLTKKLHWGCTKLKCIWKSDTIVRLRKSKQMHVMESHRVNVNAIYSRMFNRVVLIYIISVRKLNEYDIVSHYTLTSSPRSH